MPRPLAPFRAWDGEGIEDGRRAQKYVLMAASDHPHLYDPNGIRTVDALGWLVEYSAIGPGHTIGFGTSYDVNMILADLPPEEVACLYMETDWEVELDEQVWRLQWIPGKLFNVQAPDGRWSRTWDVFGFFQCSFVGALQRWGLEVPDYLLEMKAKRGTFAGGHEWELKAYSELECGLLVELMERVRSSLRSNGISPRTWHGAGAIAGAALRTAGTRKYVGRSSRHPNVEEHLLQAYFGGRTELFAQGEVPAATQYDVNSAYASALRLLPDGRGQWRPVRRWAGGQWNPWGLWRVEWQIDDPAEPLTPFPFRQGRGIFWPLEGEGWYHAAEVRAALRLYPEHIRVFNGFVFEPKEPAATPFEFVDDLYALRNQLKAAGDPTASALKFGLASVWGKTSQAISRDGRVPTYQDYFWAGATTAIVRGWMLELAAAHKERLMQISTDGILFAGHERSPLDKLCGRGLGQLRCTRLHEVLLAQSGMMSAWDADSGEQINHTRGFFRREIDFEKLRAVWRADGPRGTLRTSGIRFHGIGTCIGSGQFTDWRKWKRAKQEIGLWSNRKYYEDANRAGHFAYRLLPPFQIRPGLSSPYQPQALTWEDLTAYYDLEFIQGTEQPMMAF